MSGVIGLSFETVPSSGENRILKVENKKQLFIDDLFFETSKNITLKVHPPRKTGEKTLQRDKSWESAVLYLGQGLIRVGDELWQYYGGSPLPHNYKGGLDTLTKPGNSITYSRVVSRLDGFVSVEAATGTGSFLTPPLIYRGDVLRLNAKVDCRGFVKVGLLDENGVPIKGRSVEDCLPVTGNHIDTIVEWKFGKSVSSESLKPTRMRVVMKKADLYAFRFGADK